MCLALFLCLGQHGGLFFANYGLAMPHPLSVYARQVYTVVYIVNRVCVCVTGVEITGAHFVLCIDRYIP